MPKARERHAGGTEAELDKTAANPPHSPPPLQTGLLNLFEELTPDPEANIQTIVDKTFALIRGTSCCNCRFLDGETVLRAWQGRAGIPAPASLKPLKAALCYRVLKENGGRPLAIANLQKAAFKRTEPDIGHVGCTSFLGCPIGTPDEIRGALCVFDTRERAYTADEVRTASLMARALALEEARLQESIELKRRLDMESMLKILSTSAIAAEDRHRFVEESLALLGETLAVGGTFIYQFRRDAQTMGLLAEWLAPATEPHGIDLSAIPATALEWSLGRLIQGELLNIPGVAEMPEGAEKEIAGALGTKSLLIVPMFIRSEFVGCIGFEDYRRHRSWSEQDIRILRTTADIIAKTIESASLKARLKADVDLTGEALTRANRLLKQEVDRHKRTIRKLKTKEKELARKNQRLNEMNSALSVLVRKRNDDIGRMENQVAHNIREMIDPSLRRLKNSGLSDVQANWLAVLENNMNEIASPLVSKLSSGYRKLTPTEIKIAGLIRYGKTNKEISEMLGISYRTVEVHRCNIRRKLQLKRRNVNLRTYLLSMDQG